ncbi:MAG: muconolactone Delta-isomerase family protein [Acidobacteriota bacterium]
MKFLVISKPIDNNLSVQKIASLLTESQQWIRKHKETGEIEALFSFLDFSKNGCISIVNYSSHEALDAALQEFPWNNYIRYEIYPLCDLEKSIENALKGLPRDSQ